MLGNKFKNIRIAIPLLLLIGVELHAQVTLPKILGNNMVLQRNIPVPIWGYATPGEEVLVNFMKQKKSARADSEGQWKVMLDAMPASSTPAVLTITAVNTIKLENILVGEVWLCSGQSNMEYTMRKNSKVVKTDSTKESPVDELQRAGNSAIRIFLVTSKNLQKPDPSHTGWSIAEDSALRSFSAVGYFFARELYDKLRVPVGVISSAVSGSAIEPWLAGSAINEQAGNQPKLKTGVRAPGKLYANMIKPLAPFALKGFLWYQGETNCFKNESVAYTYKMKDLINEWRNLWHNKNIPFYYVQIAPFYYSKSGGKYPLSKETLPKFWEAQARALNVPNTGMVVTTDLVVTPGDLHPAFKWEVGRRLALWALSKNYGVKVTPSGPIYKQMEKKNGKVALEFYYTGRGLTSKDGKALSNFEIAGQDEKFVPAMAVIMGNKVLLSSPLVPDPVSARFEWTEEGRANFYNKDGLPAVPFRTDFDNVITNK